MNINSFLLRSMNDGASDLHLSAGISPMLRINGELIKTELPAVSKEVLDEFLQSLLNDHQRNQFDLRTELDFCVDLQSSGRFRVNIFNQHRGRSAVFRVIPELVPTFEKLATATILEELALLPRGLVLITGPTGSGKSSTLAAMINYINEHRQYHIITIEDPIEFVHKNKQSLIHQRELVTHTTTFGSALRASLREDPDVVVIGEMRDLETIRLALTAAETGHLVLATLHTASAASTINRIIDVFPAAEKDLVRSMLSESLRGVVCQNLVKNLKGGRSLASEILIGTPAVRNLIREDKIPQLYSVMQTNSSAQMRTLDQSLQLLLDNEVIEESVAKDKASVPKSIKK